MVVGSKIPRASRARRAEVIASRDNRWLKRLRASLRGGEITPEGWIGVEGTRLVEEALRSGQEVAAVLISESGERHLRRLGPWLTGAVRLLRTSDRLFSGIADTLSPQGVAALVRPRAATFDDILRGGPAAEALVVVLAGVQDPGNVGTILRSAEAMGATGAAACTTSVSGSANPLSPKAIRASAGAVLRLPVLHGVALPILLAQLRVARVKLFAACPDDRELVAQTESTAGPPVLAPWEADLTGPFALLIGNEGAGLPREVETSADALLRIPLVVAHRGASTFVDSLNAAVAASVLLYEAAKQRRPRSETSGDIPRTIPAEP